VRLLDREVQGLGLAAAALDRFYAANAAGWYPGIEARRL
jgi:hypothetical protein